MSSAYEATATTPLLPPSPSRPHLRPLRRRPTRRDVHFIPITFLLIIFVVVALLAWDVSSYGNCFVAPLCRVLGDERGLEDTWWENAGPYAPFRSMGKGGGTNGLPRGCEVDQVTILHRHTARFPTTDHGKCILGALNKLKNREIRSPRHHPELSFINKADLNLKDWAFDDLTDQGRKAAWRSGRELARVYEDFLDEAEDPPFIRSSGGGRVVETAGYWLEGFRGHSFKLKAKSRLPLVDVIVPEGSEANNTLSIHSCPAFNDISGHSGADAQLKTLLEPALNRLNNVLKPKPPLEIGDLTCLADMCDYDSQALGSNWQGWSKWCGIFDQGEWELLGHIKDVARYYEVGPGGRYARTMGSGYVNELIARLTDSAVIDSTITNRTTDGDEKTFPRGGKRLFMDFGHDNEMLEVLAALGVLTQHRPLPTDSVPIKRTYVLSKVVPFGGKFTFERVACDMGNWEPDPNADTGEMKQTDDRGKDGKRDYIRIFINDALKHVDHLACKQSGLVEHGLCELDSFLDSQNFARNEANWAICYELEDET